ncbi:XRE family transcriptional regulator [Kitasatospora indigofera]|uniref:XRE family transcriptional regulator n=1 Tax=Kitasatospora indigofera TaxID=67307 RepID=A0A919G3W1_9ACTN|nr:helix-turn-helix transcriptional regulator [Kitasatospora indigofera]GHH77555.1 XRE family transcriptional regulator [Kitasatospora indigofera]
MDFPQALRERRTRRRLSQLELADRAGTTQRHLSFIETGRSTPGRDLVVRLAESLELPLRERNDLLLSAGFAPAYPGGALDGPELAPVLDALGNILTGHLPWPAVVVDRYGELVAANAAFGLLTEGVPAELLGPAANVYRVALHPQGLAPRIGNFAEWAQHVLTGLRREAERHPDERLDALHAELRSYLPDRAPAAAPLGFAVPLELHSRHGLLRLITTVTTFATATDVTLAELKLEAFLPADRATSTILSGLGGARRQGRRAGGADPESEGNSFSNIAHEFDST